jgi:4-hydroxybenzoate polyprenyltransferase
VRRLPHLYLRMLRYRVAAMIWLFMLLPAAFHGALADLSLDYLWAALALASSYVAATAVNDIADREIDLVNHPRDGGRPLVTGDATVRDLAVLHVVAGAGALAAGALVSPVGLDLAALSLGIAWTYSLPPVRFAYRTYLAPVVLGVAYVLVPYALGLEAAGLGPTWPDARFAGALFCLFCARIVLKDFRDRAGDALYGKPTLLLRFGKRATCALSLAALAAGDALLVLVLPEPVLIVIAQVFAAAIAWMLWKLWCAAPGQAEQVAIGIGARMGNGLLLCVLAWLVLEAHGADAERRLAFVAALAAVFAGGYVALAARPEQAVIGYKG